MKKTLMALAVGAAFAAPSAFADVTISGAINMGIAYAKSGDGATTAGNSIIGPVTAGAQGVGQASVTQNYSNVTISSTDDIGNGMKVDFAYQITAPTAGNNGVFNRNSHIGVVSESWGGVWYGTNENIYERYLYTIDPLDGAAGIGGNLQMLGTPGYGTVFQAVNGSPANKVVDFYNRTENTVWYDSPNWNGFTFGAAYMLPAYNVANGLNPTMWSLGAKYASPAIPLAVWVAYEKRNDFNGLAVIRPTNSAASNASDTGAQLGVSYTLGDIILFGVIEQLKYKTDFAAGVAADVSEYKRNAWNLGLKWNLATGYVGAQYIQASNASCTTIAGGCNASETGGKMVGLGYYHTLTKQSQAYVMGTWIDNNNNARYALAGAGTPSSAPGATQSAITVGLKHTF